MFGSEPEAARMVEGQVINRPVNLVILVAYRMLRIDPTVVPYAHVRFSVWHGA